MKHVYLTIRLMLITHSSLTLLPVVAWQQFGLGVKLLARPHSSYRQTGVVAGVSWGC
ncbi:hypothetical protein [Scytonema sp. PRP1]|uniref:hypothetical protein n=1 Tax=Scytonema sp. PRP1 TaxID=3120513 RepID=UPI002FD2D58D